MDRAQLVTIAVTAVISVIAKEVVTWAVSLVRTLSVIKTIREKVKKIFSRNNLAIFGNLFWLAWLVVLLAHEVRKSTPPTRVEIALIVALIVGIVFQIGFLTFHITWIQAERVQKLDRP
jgi:hypothetical protein